VVIGADIGAIKIAALDRDIVEVKGVMATALEAVRPVGASVPVTPRVVLHARPLLRRVEADAGHLVFEVVWIDFVVEFAVVMADDALDAIGPRAGLLQFQFPLRREPVRRIGIIGGRRSVEDRPHLVLRIGLQ
jgi:hypothetical protein